MRGLASLVGREERAQTIENVWGPQWGEYPGSSSWSGKSVTNQSALQLLTVYGCVRFIVDGITTLPVDVYRTLPDGTKEPVTTPSWLENPAPGLDRVAWMSQILTSLLLDGNAYLLITTFNGLQLTPLDPGKVEIHSVNGRRVYLVNGVMVDAIDIVHIPAIMYPGSLKGLSPVESARQSIGQGLSAQEYASRFLGQGLTMPGVIETTEPLPPEGPGSAKDMAKQFARLHSGADKLNLPGVLVNATWKTTGVTNDQAQFLESRQFTAAEIAGSMFLVDASELNIGVTGTALMYGNMTERGTRKVQVTFLPWIVRLENAVSAILAKPRFMKLNVNGLLRGDLKTRYDSYAVGITTGFLEKSEARAFEDLPPVAGIDDTPEPPAVPAPVTQESP